VGGWQGFPLVKGETFLAFSERQDTIEGTDGRKLTADLFDCEIRTTFQKQRGPDAVGGWRG